MWTFTFYQDAFLGLTIHYINSNWHLQNFLLNIIPFSISHSGVNIAQSIINVLDEFNIKDKIIALTTDNEVAMLVCERKIASNLNLAFSTIIFSHYRYIAHVLNLEVKHRMKLVHESIIKACKLMIKIKNSTSSVMIFVSYVI